MATIADYVETLAGFIDAVATRPAASGWSGLGHRSGIRVLSCLFLSAAVPCACLGLRGLAGIATGRGSQPAGEPDQGGIAPAADSFVASWIPTLVAPSRRGRSRMS